jgi:hypothetical protein
MLLACTATFTETARKPTSVFALPFLNGTGYRSRHSDSLRAGRSGDQIPVASRYSIPVHNGPGIKPSSCTMGTGSFPGVKRPGRGVDHPPPSSAEVKERVEVNLYSPFGPSRPVLGRTLPFTLPRYPFNSE